MDPLLQNQIQTRGLILEFLMQVPYYNLEAFTDIEASKDLYYKRSDKVLYASGDTKHSFMGLKASYYESLLPYIHIFNIKDVNNPRHGFVSKSLDFAYHKEFHSSDLFNPIQYEYYYSDDLSNGCIDLYTGHLGLELYAGSEDTLTSISNHILRILKSFNSINVDSLHILFTSDSQKTVYESKVYRDLCIIINNMNSIFKDSSVREFASMQLINRASTIVMGKSIPMYSDLAIR